MSWGKRFDIPERHYPGVYVIAISERDLTDVAVRWLDVVYIGMTQSKGGLTQRWSQFQNSVRGRNGHSGGWAIFNHAGGDSELESKLFVAAMPVKCNPEDPSPSDLRRLGCIAYLEYEAFSKFARNTPEAKPLYNTL